MMIDKNMFDARLYERAVMTHALYKYNSTIHKLRCPCGNV